MKTYILDEAQRSRLMELLDRASGVARNGDSIREARAILHTIAELDKAKALTDEEIDRAAHENFPRIGMKGDSGFERDRCRRAGFRLGVRYARDHGYLAPSAGNGLSIDDAMEIVIDAYKDGLAGARGGLGRYRERLEAKAKHP